MLRKSLLVFVLGVLLLSAVQPGQPAQAQAVDWSVTVFDRDARGFLIVTPNGLQPGPAVPGMQALASVYNVRVSPRGEYAVFVGTPNDNSPSLAYVANLLTGACCTPLQDPTQPSLGLAFIGPFSPDGRQIVLSSFDQAALGRDSVPSAITVYDLATASVAASVPLSAFQPIDPGGVAAVFGTWDKTGIRLIPSCYGCEGVWEGAYHLWEPTSGAISLAVEPFDIFMNRLPGTGELFKLIANEAYPQSGAPSAYFPAPNVVEYYPAPNAPQGQVVYFDVGNPHLSQAEWVDGGRAILIKTAGLPASLPDNPFGEEGPGTAILMFRDGLRFSIDPALGSALTGTPDGWIALDWNSGAASLVRSDAAGNYQVTPLGDGSGWELAATSFVLGSGTAATPFPAVPPPQSTTCPGFVTSRLWPNTFAQVTPGASNNLRAEPSSASALVGTIPGEGVVAVLIGPTCAGNMAWWQVQYNGLIGWTAEGQGSDYWLQPGSGMW